MLNVFLVSLLTIASVKAQDFATVSPDCQAAIERFKVDTGFASCINPILSATAAFAPGSASPLSAANVTKALETMCSSSATAACQTEDKVIRNKITEFGTACKADLQSRNPVITDLYDTLYLLSPFRSAACAKDGSGAFCALNIAEGTDDAAGSRGAIESAIQLAKSQLTISSPPKPNLNTFSQSSLPFLFLLPTLPASQLCTTCSRNILTAYARFESQTPYAIGLAQSPALGNQAELWQAAKSTCEEEWFQGIVSSAVGNGPNANDQTPSNAGNSVGTNGAAGVRANDVVVGLVAVLMTVAAAF